MKGNVIITGGNSQLAQCMKSVLSTRGMSFLFDYNYIFATREELDITEEESIKNFISQYDDVKYIVNCAAYTKVDQAQLEYETCKKINSDGVKNLGKYCKEHDIFLITFGTDYMYGSQKILSPITEGLHEDYDEYFLKNFAGPENVYGMTKKDGYLNLCELWPANEYEKHFLFINTSWLYSEFGNNFVKKIYNAVKNGEHRKVVIDQIGTPTYAQNLARFIIDYIELDEKPLLGDGYKPMLNFAGKGIASWYDLAKTVEDVVKENNATESLVQPCLSSEFRTNAYRQQYTPLSTKLLEDKFGIDAYTRYWREDVEMCVKNLKLIDKINNTSDE